MDGFGHIPHAPHHGTVQKQARVVDNHRASGRCQQGAPQIIDDGFLSVAQACRLIGVVAAARADEKSPAFDEDAVVGENLLPKLYQLLQTRLLGTCVASETTCEEGRRLFIEQDGQHPREFGVEVGADH